MIGDGFFCLGLHTSFVCVDEDFIGEAASLALGLGEVIVGGAISFVTNSLPLLLTTLF